MIDGEWKVPKLCHFQAHRHIGTLKFYILENECLKSANTQTCLLTHSPSLTATFN